MEVLGYIERFEIWILELVRGFRKGIYLGFSYGFVLFWLSCKIRVIVYCGLVGFDMLVRYCDCLFLILVRL